MAALKAINKNPTKSDDYSLNVSALTRLEFKRARVELRGDEAVLVEGRYLVHLYNNYYEDKHTGISGYFTPGVLDFV